MEVASVTSCGAALSIQTDTGSPLRSATAMIFVPLPRFVFPTLHPFFGRSETRVDECLAHIECAFGTEFFGKSGHDLCHNIRANPLLKAPMVGLERGVSVGEVRPGRTGAQYPHDAVEDGAAAFPRPPSPVRSCSWFWNKRVEDIPLFIGQITWMAHTRVDALWHSKGYLPELSHEKHARTARRKTGGS